MAGQCCCRQLTAEELERLLDAEYLAGNTHGTTKEFNEYYTDRSHLKACKGKIPVLDEFLDDVMHGKLLETPQYQTNPMKVAYRRLRLAGISRKGLIQLTNPPLEAIK